MALTEEQKKEIREFLEQEQAEKKKSILSSLKSFADWVETVSNIVVAIQTLKPLFDLLCSLFS